MGISDCRVQIADEILLKSADQDFGFRIADEILLEFVICNLQSVICNP